jgi:16S rRNA (cytosine1402-N4)-methyltransferase
MQRRRSTTPGEHRPVLLDAVLEALDPQPGQIAVDCTVGWAGHSVEILRRLGPSGFLLGIDWDADDLPKARDRLADVGGRFHLEHANFAALPAILARNGLQQVDLVLADLGMSSMQVDDPERGFSYRRDGPLDMRMDRSRGKTAAQILASISEHDLASALRELGDEGQADVIAAAIAEERRRRPLERTAALAALIQRATGQTNWRLHTRPHRWRSHPAAKTFQALRLLVNRELGNLRSLVRILPECLRAGGCAAIVSFHSGEDRLVKEAFRSGGKTGVYRSKAQTVIRPAVAECRDNPRARSAKLRWARKW